MCNIYLQVGVANGTLKNVGFGKFRQDLEISKAFLTSLEILFLHGLFCLFGIFVLNRVSILSVFVLNRVSFLGR